MMGFINGRQLTAYHCHDVVDKTHAGSKAQRFCIPLGGNDWPHHQGYPGVTAGLLGWGLPAIKNTVPGNNEKGKTTKGTKVKGEKLSSEVETKASRRSLISAPLPDHSSKSTKKETIHVGYGYASGDNYRLGYGFGGMGGVSGFNRETAGAAEHSYRSKIPNSKNSEVKVKNNIPTPETTKDVNASKRNIGASNNPSSIQPGTAPYNQPQIHPGFTTMGYPGHGNSQVAVSQVGVLKDKIGEAADIKKSK